MKKRTILILLAGLPLAPGSSAAILFADTFDRSDSRNIDASMDGISDHTGSGLGIDTVYGHGHLDPNSVAPGYGVEDGAAPNGGGARIIGNSLQLAVGPGTSNAYVNHNFTNPMISSWGGFSVTVDVTGYAQSGAGFGGGFGVGMSLLEAQESGDAISGATKMQDGFSQDVFNSEESVSVADFWVLLRGDSTLAWGGAGNAITGASIDTAFFGSAPVGGKTGSISVQFSNVSDFAAGTSVDYAIFFNGNAVDGASGSFSWSGTNENYIGLDGRDSAGVSFDNFVVEAIPEPSVALLGVIGMSMFIRRRR